ncbi:coniferyl aldehyde dehydrogenase [Nitrospirillum sp. BR 11828]|uniref:coniferyl aldehyde dehydrogenase n=1 Tax=Nitrospirillum sp. BR 11828 TaxID=3104325 RepID=UPI002ACA39A2|nr:coniferyl aldehyde dehydrogenase [Nitrospirillum sp. BR 11828]MDZ5650575.1 coniferyl aldehyde dehydrogenase [Nitrospirillum sp. BR 11828]
MMAVQQGGAPDLAVVEQAFGRLRGAARQDAYPSAARRRDWLAALERGLVRRRDALVQAVDADFGGRLAHETLFAEIFVSLEGLRQARRHLAGWMRPRCRSVPLALGPGRAWVQPQPLGVVGIIAPWNYPLFLALGPLAGALAAGNRVLLKPSELTPRTTALIADLVAEAVGPDVAAVVSGGPEVGAQFGRLPFDHILFTGSTRVGRLVMKAAAENLTPVTLELGGKSPALVLPDADLTSAATDIAYGKFTNAGQTCVAPDYVLVPRSRVQDFVAALAVAVPGYFPPGQGAGQGASAMSAVFGAAGRARMADLVAEAKARGAEVRELGPPVPGLAMGPAVVLDPPEDIVLQREEIFGPILPIVPYDKVEDALDYVRDRPRPLAFYLFGRDRTLIDRALKTIAAGGVVVNDTLIHVAVEDLPFGGIGPSGMGRYHGRDGFDTFSHLKAVFDRKGPRLDRLARPPLKPLHRWLIKLLIGG